jgi:hypothetical protein
MPCIDVKMRAMCLSNHVNYSFVCCKSSSNSVFDMVYKTRQQVYYFHQQMHQDKIVTVFFIKRVPQYVFRQLYCHHFK